MPPGQNTDTKITISGDGSQLEQVVNKLGALLSDLRNQASNINVGGTSGVTGGGGRAASASSAAGVAAASTIQAPMNPGRGSGPAPQTPRTGQRVSGAAAQAGATAFQPPTASPRVQAQQAQPTVMMPTMPMMAGGFPGQAPSAAAYMHWAAQQQQAMQAGSGGAFVGGGSGVPPVAGGPGGGGAPFGFSPGPGGVYRGMMNQQGAIRMRLQGGAGAFVGLQAASGAARFAADAINYQTDRLLVGGDDPMARAKMIAGGISTAIGVGTGLMFGPMAGFMAAGLSESVLDPIARYLAAPEANRLNANQSLMPYFSSVYGRGGMNAVDVYTSSMGRNRLNMNDPYNPIIIPALSRLERMRDFVNPQLTEGIKTSTASIGATLGAINSSMFQSGLNPEARGDFMPGILRRPFEEGQRTTARQDYNAAYGQASFRDKSHGFRLIDTLINNALGDIKSQAVREPGFQETIGETYTKRLSLILGNDAPAGAKRVAPMFSREFGERGGNIADLLMKFGPESTLLYERMLSKDLQSPIDPRELSRISGEMAANSRQRTLGALQVRGRGAAATGAALADMNTLAQLPEGKQSVAYAEANAARRSGLQQFFHEQDTMRYDIPRDALNARRDIARELPYQPGYGMRFAMESLQMRSGEITEKTGRFRTLMSMGDLSEDQERAYRKELLDLKVEQAHDIGTLAEGGPNRMRAMFAGGLSRRGRFDSMSMARTALWKSGHPRQDYGFAGGAHMAHSDDWFAQFGVAVDPISRTSQINAPNAARGMIGAGASGGVTRTTSPAQEQLLAKIAGSLERIERGMGGSMSNPGGGPQVASARSRTGDALALTGRNPRSRHGLIG